MSRRSIALGVAAILLLSANRITPAHAEENEAEAVIEIDADQGQHYDEAVPAEADEADVPNMYSEESNTNTGETRAEIGDDGIVAQAASTGHLEEALADTTGGMDAAAMAQEAARETAAAHEQRLEQQRQAEAKVADRNLQDKVVAKAAAEAAERAAVAQAEAEAAWVQAEAKAAAAGAAAAAAAAAQNKKADAQAQAEADRVAAEKAEANRVAAEQQAAAAAAEKAAAAEEMIDAAAGQQEEQAMAASDQAKSDHQDSPVPQEESVQAAESDKEVVAQPEDAVYEPKDVDTGVGAGTDDVPAPANEEDLGPPPANEQDIDPPPANGEDLGPTEDEDVASAFPISDEAKMAYTEALAFSADVDSSNYYAGLASAAALEHPAAAMALAMVQLFGNITTVPRDVEAAFESVSSLAARGHPRAQALLSFMYSMGIGTNSSQSKALLYMTFAALGGDTFAQMNLGYRHHVGMFVPKSCEISLKYYRAVADKVHLEALDGSSEMIERVRLADEKRRKRMKGQAHVLQYYQLTAQQGGVESQVVMGQLFYHGGHGYAQDLPQAVRFFERAAGAGDATAKTLLAEMHANGRGVPQNNATALKYYEEAAKKENPAALAGLGVLYKLGQGVTKSEKKAFELFSKAAALEDSEGQLRLAHQYFDGLGTKRDYRKAIHYYSLAAQQGHVLAMYSLGEIHATGTGTSRNCELAAGLFKNVAERGSWSKLFAQAYDAYEDDKVDTAALMYMFLGELGYEMAQNNAAFILDETYEEDPIFGHNGSLGRALTGWKRSADQGHTAARLKIGDYHYYGHAVEEDHGVAANEYRLAADNSNAQAMFNLGWMHEYGIGLPVDLHLAKRYYDQATETSNDAKLPSAIALTGLQTKLWLQANFGTGAAGLEAMMTDAMEAGENIQNMSFDEILSAYENVFIGMLVVVLAILLLARQLQQQQAQQVRDQAIAQALAADIARNAAAAQRLAQLTRDRAPDEPAEARPL